MGCMWRICARKRCSFWMARSITSLKDAAAGAESPPLCDDSSLPPAGEEEDAESCASAGRKDTKINQNENKPICKLRIKYLRGEQVMPIEKQCARRLWNRLVGRSSSPA